MTAAIRPDRIETICGAVCQHGPLNRRIYLMNVGDAEPYILIPVLERLAAQNGYTKIFAKIPASKAAAFYAADFRKEAAVPGFFGGEEEALFLGRYFEAARKRSNDQPALDAVLETALKKQQRVSQLPPLPGTHRVRRCTPNDVAEMSRLYRRVFPSYPFPIQDPVYLRETMASHVVYFAVVARDEIVALSSSEMDTGNRNVEMTDFATRPDERGRGLASYLLEEMERAMIEKKIPCAYTISRAASYPINITFSSMGYTYGGRLVNNTNISGQIESMTVWYKRLVP
jgi:putative beta-lysine N-acetyltransferase